MAWTIVNVLLVNSDCTPTSFQEGGSDVAEVWLSAARRVVSIAENPIPAAKVVAFVYMQEVGKEMERHLVSDLRAHVNRSDVEKFQAMTERCRPLEAAGELDE